MTTNDDYNNGRGNNGRNNNSGDDAPFSWRLVAKLGVIARYTSGWTKELNLIEWNGNPAKFDIRDWDPKHVHMRKGITLHRGEAERLFKLLGEQFDSYFERKDEDEWDNESSSKNVDVGPLVDNSSPNAVDPAPLVETDGAKSDDAVVPEAVVSGLVETDFAAVSSAEEGDYLAKSA